MNRHNLCPACHETGKAIAVRMQIGRVIVNFHCPRCQAEWEKIRPKEQSGEWT
jgi:hypothetical protein